MASGARRPAASSAWFWPCWQSRAEHLRRINSNTVTGGTAQSCQETYSDPERQIAVARTLVDTNFKKQEIDCNGDPDLQARRREGVRGTAARDRETASLSSFAPTESPSVSAAGLLVGSWR
jgi:hypothetical protein